MHELLDQQMAARIKAECRDASELHRFQRATWILAQLLDGLGFPRTAKAFQLLRAGAGEIPADPPDTPPPRGDLEALNFWTTDPAAAAPVSPLAMPQPAETDVLTGKKKRARSLPQTR